MSQNPIKYGSIIHLENGAPDGGYLGSSRSVIEEDVLNGPDPAVLTFIFTHLFENRVGSSSWEILPDPDSPKRKAIHTAVEYGDKIRLRNMHPDAAYLDIFDWVTILREPFNEYKSEMHNGVFTLDTRVRPAPHNIPQAEWTVVSADDPKKSGVVHEGDRLHLKNNYILERGLSLYHYKSKLPTDQTSYLTTYRKVSENIAFDEEVYAGERMFVFVGPKSGDNSTLLEDGSKRWTITSSNSSQNFYHLWGKPQERWLDYGVFKIGQLLGKSLIRLKIKAEKSGAILKGKVSYAGEGILNFEATQHKGNLYKVQHKLNSRKEDEEILKFYPDGDWELGARQDKNIVALDIASADNGRTFTGVIQYDGEEPIRIKGRQPSTNTFTQDNKPLFYDFFEPDIWKKRIKKIEDALSLSDDDLNETLMSIGGFSIATFRSLIKKSAANNKSHLYGKLTEILIEEDSATLASSPQTAPHDHDVESQIVQLLNIYTVWDCMRTFWKAFSDATIQTIGRLEAQGILSPVHTLSAIMGQFTVDFEIVRRAIQQRQSAKAGQNGQAGDVQAKSLLVADKFATKSLTPIKGWLGDDAPITPITFFAKSIHIRQLPYTKQFIFIGLTFDVTAAVADFITDSAAPSQTSILPFELMAIPHEVGHFVYHASHATPSAPGNDAQTGEHHHHDHDDNDAHAHGSDHSHGHKHRDPQPNTIGWLSSHLSHNPYHHWCEEIFSDLYGCLVSGPLTVLGIQAVLATGDKQRLMLDDSAHPTPILRPYLMSEMLRVLADLHPAWAGFQATAMILDANWTAILDRWGIVVEGVYNGRPARIIMPTGTDNHLEQVTEVNITRAIEESRKIIEAFANVLFNIKPKDVAAYKRFAEIFNVLGSNREKKAQVDELVQTYERFKVDLTRLPWVGKQDSDSLHTYADSFGQLVTQALGAGGDDGLQLAEKAQLTDELRHLINGDSTDHENVVEVGENAFRKLLASWHDSGPKSGNFGG